MGDTAAAQLRRILTIIPRFADDQDHPIEEIAAAAGTTPDQMLTDFESITRRFFDVAGFLDSVRIELGDKTVSMITSEFHRPMRLTIHELCALELGLTMLRLERTPADHAAIDRARGRLERTITALPSNDGRNDVRHGSLAAAGDAAHLVALREAVRAHRTVRLSYHAGGATDRVERVVAPHAIVHVEHMWYAVSVGDDHALRHYRLDRIEQVELLEERFERDDTVLERVLRTGRAFAADHARRMTVRYSAQIARWVAEREGATVSADGTLTLEHPVADDAWAVRHVLQYGPEAELLAPPDLRALVVQRLEAMAGA